MPEIIYVHANPETPSVDGTRVTSSWPWEGDGLPKLVIGTDGADTLEGGGGRDLLLGLGGNDLLEGKGGSDILDGGAGADTLIGGAGNDRYVVDDAGDVVTEAAHEGVDTVFTSLASHALGANVENLVHVGAAAFTGTGNALDNLIVGGAGNDTLDGGAGQDTLIGGWGDDVYHVDNAGDRIVERSFGGVDHVIASTDYTLPSHVENLTVTDSHSGVGNGGNNVIAGGDGANDLRGGGGADTLGGGAGNDTLRGGWGSDQLTGGAGDDVLIGGLGQDTFHFSAGFGKDVITDFTVNTPWHDVIDFDSVFTDLTHALANASQSGGDVVFAVDAANTLTVKNTTIAQLAAHPEDFQFA